jgi:hypothetical protein
MRSRLKTWQSISLTAFLMVVGLLLIGGRANASCGNYVVFGDSMANDAIQHPNNADEHHSLPDRPCSGPFCKSNSNYPPASPAPSLNVTSAKEVANLSADIDTMTPWNSMIEPRRVFRLPFDPASPPVPPPRSAR